MQLIWSKVNFSLQMSVQVLQKHLKSFKIGSLVHTCIVSTFALYTLCKCLVQSQNLHIGTSKGWVNNVFILIDQGK